MATTPPPASHLRTPPTPLHGARYDSYEPYSPRRSSRIRARGSNEQLANSTNSSLTSFPSLQPTPRKPLARHGSDISSQTLSPPSSPVSPVRRGKSPTRAQFLNGMLPTPAKTPRKHGVPGLFPASRTATPQDVMPTPRRSRATKSFTLDDEPDNDKIQVYTDTADRVPEVDEDADNPFVVRKGARKPKISSFTQRLSDVTSGKTKYGMSREIDEAVDNDQGMVYTFRGRKIYRKFDEPADTSAFSEPSDIDLLASDNADAVHLAGAAARTRLSRATVKPRLLFPPREPSPNPDDTDEEADTDIDEEHLDVHAHSHTQSEEMDELADASIAHSFADVTSTPQKHKPYMPATPPTTGRTTRHGKLAFTPEASPDKERRREDVVERGARLFDSWQRTKPGFGAVEGMRSRSLKRAGEEMGRERGEEKRARSSRV